MREQHNTIQDAVNSIMREYIRIEKLKFLGITFWANCKDYSELYKAAEEAGVTDVEEFLHIHLGWLEMETAFMNTSIKNLYQNQEE